MEFLAQSLDTYHQTLHANLTENNFVILVILVFSLQTDSKSRNTWSFQKCSLRLFYVEVMTEEGFLF